MTQTTSKASEEAVVQRVALIEANPSRWVFPAAGFLGHLDAAAADGDRRDPAAGSIGQTERRASDTAAHIEQRVLESMRAMAARASIRASVASGSVSSPARSNRSEGCLPSIRVRRQ
jgi:hypothetical protein